MFSKKLNPLLVFCIILSFCSYRSHSTFSIQNSTLTPFIVVLGTAQDGGYPHAGCKKSCCEKYYSGKEKRHYVSCLALIDHVSKQRWLFDCTPDFTLQLHLLDSLSNLWGQGAPMVEQGNLSGIFLTHAHIGHYTGLMYLGREAMNTHDVPVYTMPRMKAFLQNNGPWSQLVTLKNIELRNLQKDSTIELGNSIKITPFRVPHRDEYSETVGFRISYSNFNVIFIPDIDKWEKWDRDIVKIVKENDILFIDGTFFKEGELPGLTIKEVPHPFMEETMNILKNLPEKEREKVHFIHLNHTNPALTSDSAAIKEIRANHCNVAREGELYNLGND
jgi:pyrroloquinoline quinone biosynthesis protein B